MVMFKLRSIGSFRSTKILKECWPVIFDGRICSRHLHFRLFRKEQPSFSTVNEELKHIYNEKLLPLEEQYLFHRFHSPKLTDQDFDAKPFVMLMGQYSTGKTTLIKYLIERDYPGIRIGPEPTTDKFIVIMGGEKESFIPGNALVADASKPFSPLSQYGNNFLSRFQCSCVPSPVLNEVSFVDTPGILSGEKQRVDRGYDFTGVLEWFAERCDRIILLFDANKLDISDEFRRSIESVRRYDEKIRIILNKADNIGHQELLRVYGALMWSLGKVLNTPEVARVYVGSLWNEPLRFDTNRRLFEDEEKDLLDDLQKLPENCVVRKVNDISKRASSAKVHAYLISTLHSKMPAFFGQGMRKIELIDSLESIFEELKNRFNISSGDFPDLEKTKSILEKQDFTKFREFDPALIKQVEEMTAVDIPRLMSLISKKNDGPSNISGGLFSLSHIDGNPFSETFAKINEGQTDSEWIVSRFRSSCDAVFDQLKTADSKLRREDAKNELMKSKLPNSVLARVWQLSDLDRDGDLDRDEFALANYLVNLKQEGHDLPSEIPEHLIPPSKKGSAESAL